MKKILICAALGALALGGLVSPANAAADDRHLFPPIYTMSPKGVNIQTGRFVSSSTEFSVGPLSFVRFKGAPEAFNFTSTSSGSTSFGGWGHNHLSGIGYRSRGSSTFYYVVVDGKGMEFAPTSPPNTTYLAWNQAAQGWSMAKSGTIITVTNNNGDAYQFQTVPGVPAQGGLPDAYYVLTRVDYADGHRLDYSYNASALPRVVSSNKGYAIVLDYDASGRISTACGFNTANNFVSTATTCTSPGFLAKTSYTYDGSANLATATDVSGAVTSFTYATNAKVATISLPNAPSTYAIQNFYGPQPGDLIPGDTKPDQVRKQITATGDIWLYSYLPYTISDLPPQPGEKRDTYSYVTNPLNELTEAKYVNGVVEYTLDLNGLYHRYIFDGLQPKSVTLPGGNENVYLVDYAGNTPTVTRKARPGSGLADIVSTRNYPVANIYSSPTVCNAASPKLCNKPTSVVDERGNQTDYTYDTAHGGVLTETGPAVNGVRVQMRYTYALRSAIVRNASNAFIASPNGAVYVLTQKAYCKTGSPNATNTGCATAGDEVITTYEYGPTSGAANNLLLRGEIVDPAGLHLRTCYAYDAQGNKIAERKALGTGTTTCPAN